MRKAYIWLVAAVLVSTAGAVASAGPRAANKDKAQGGISLTVHAHSSEFKSPQGHQTLFPTNPLDIPVASGDSFSYSSVPCDRAAPFNDKALNFNPDYPGLEDPAPVRHFIEGTIGQVDGDRGTLDGTLTTILCVDGDESAHQIFSTFHGRFKQVSDNELRVRGTFEITGGTGMFEDIRGGGSIKGSLTCLPGTLASQQADSCADLGAFADAVFRLAGTYSDPTTQ